MPQVPKTVPVSSQPQGPWTIATDDTRLSVGVTKEGQLCVYELSNPAAGWNWTKEPLVFTMQDNGASQSMRWIYKDGVLDKTDG